MAFMKVDRLLQFTTSSGNKLQSLMVAGKIELCEGAVVQMGSLCY